MEQLVKWHKLTPTPWECTMFPLDNFTLALVRIDIEKFFFQFLNAAFSLIYLWNNRVEHVQNFVGGVTTSQSWIIWRSTPRRPSSCYEWKNFRRWSISSSSIDLIRVVYGSGKYSDLDSTGWTLTLKLSMAWWLSLPIIAETTGLVLGGHVLDFKWSAGGWMFHSIGGSFGYSPQRALNWLIFILILGWRNLGPHMMQASELCPTLP